MCNYTYALHNLITKINKILNDKIYLDKSKYNLHLKSIKNDWGLRWEPKALYLDIIRSAVSLPSYVGLSEPEFGKLDEDKVTCIFS